MFFFESFPKNNLHGTFHHATVNSAPTVQHHQIQIRCDQYAADMSDLSLTQAYLSNQTAGWPFRDTGTGWTVLPHDPGINGSGCDCSKVIFAQTIQAEGQRPRVDVDPSVAGVDTPFYNYDPATGSLGADTGIKLKFRRTDRAVVPPQFRDGKLS